MSAPAPRDAITGLELGPLLGRGGMGTVWRARDPCLDREVAVKLIHTSNPIALARFAREGQLTAALTHPGIVRVYATGTTVRGEPYLVLELVEGARTLEEVCAGAPLRRRVEWVAAAAEALGAAHERGIVHRDVKPENLLVGADGRVRVTDFGLATAFELERLTRTGLVAGTPAFMAPEQICGQRELGAAVDVWALGCVLYLVLTGRVPFEGETFPELAAAIAGGRFPPPRELVPDLPASLKTVLLRALSASPADRHPDGAALAADLRAWLAGQAPARGRRRPARLAAGGLALLLLGAAGAAWRFGRGGPPVPPAPEQDERAAGPTADLAGLSTEALAALVSAGDPARADAARVQLARAVREEDPAAALELLRPLASRVRVAEGEIPLLLQRFESAGAREVERWRRGADPATLAALRGRARWRLARAIPALDWERIDVCLTALAGAGPDALSQPTLDLLLLGLAARTRSIPGVRRAPAPPSELHARLLRTLDALVETGVRARRCRGAEELIDALRPHGGGFELRLLTAGIRLDLDFDLDHFWYDQGDYEQESFPHLAAVVAINKGRATQAQRALMVELGPVQRARACVSEGRLKEALELDPEGPLPLLAVAAERLSCGDVPGCVKVLERLAAACDGEAHQPGALRVVRQRRASGTPPSVDELLRRLSEVDPAAASPLLPRFPAAQEEGQ